MVLFPGKVGHELLTDAQSNKGKRSHLAMIRADNHGPTAGDCVNNMCHVTYTTALNISMVI